MKLIQVTPFLNLKSLLKTILFYLCTAKGDQLMANFIVNTVPEDIHIISV